MTQTINTSGLKPLGRAVLVEPYEPERVNSIIEIPDIVKDKTIAADTRVVVIEIGEACWPDEPPRAKVGDKVLISKFAGFVAVGTADNKRYRFINDRDVFAQIVKEKDDE